MQFLKYSRSAITYLFYALFFVTPFLFSSKTSELFELNKIWFAWIITILIAAFWFSQMIIEKRIRIQRTPLDIPLLLFIISQIISTIFSLDQRISWWGYYSRFNGGLLSLLTYYFLYYALVSNLGRKEVLRIIVISLVSGLIVTLWGIPSHFGYDPTCLLFRGTFDVSCWTEAFKPTIRIFSTLGQPAWLAAYLAILLPFSLSSALLKYTQKSSLLAFAYFILSILFYLALTFTNTRAGFLGFWITNGLFWLLIFLSGKLKRTIFIRSFFLFNLSFLLLAFFLGTTFSNLDNYTFQGLRAKQAVTLKQNSSVQAKNNTSDSGITDSGKIRLIVWKGALEAWKKNPLFGTGVETFAFAYYLNRPAEHNLTSEWDYLYNKAHNEYLNYLTTTGIFGLGTYLLVFIFFFFLMFKNTLTKMKKNIEFDENWILSLGLLCGLGSIFITNFFGFSVVVTNLYLFLIPALIFILLNSLSKNSLLSFPRHSTSTQQSTSLIHWTAFTLIWIASLYFIFLLFRFWQADLSYALGTNLQKSGDIQGAYTQLANAVQLRPSEPVFQDEYAVNIATIGTAFIKNGEATTGAKLDQDAVILSDLLTKKHPNNITFWKSRVRIFYTLSQIDPQYLHKALEAMQKTSQLAPTDAKIMYNLGVLYGQNHETTKAIEALSKTITLKPNYRDAYYARALFYHELATGKDTESKTEYQKKADSDLNFILKNLNPDDEQAKLMLESWQ